MAKIQPGSDAAWTVRRLLESWIDQDELAVASALTEAAHNPANVVKHLIIVVGGTIDAIANTANRTYDEVLPYVWQSLAAQADDEAARLMRETITAWTATGDSSAAEALNEAGAFSEVDFDELVMHFLATAVKLARSFAKHSGEPFSEATDGWWKALGTRDE